MSSQLAVELGLEDCLMFTGFISDEDMVQIPVDCGHLSGPESV